MVGNVEQVLKLFDALVFGAVLYQRHQPRLITIFRITPFSDQPRAIDGNVK